MDVLSLTRVYLTANIVLLLAWLMLAAARRLRGDRAIPFRAQLAFGYGALVVLLVMPVAATTVGHDFLPQAAQVWSAATMQVDALPAAREQHVTMSFAPEAASIGLDRLAFGAGVILLAGASIALTRLALGLGGALRVIARGKTLRRRRSLRIVASDAVAVPFSFWVPGRHYIVLPAALLASLDDLRFAIRHEAQHHRQGDTKLLYGMQLLLGTCFWNPAAYRFVNALRELQEFVCDEAIVRQPEVSASAYCRCLVRIAEGACARRAALVCMSMAEDGRASVFSQRIEHMMQRPIRTMRRASVTGLALAGLALLFVAAVTLAASVKDRRITDDDAERMAAIARASTNFPIVVNDSVVQELNRYLGTPDGRKFMRDSLDRMQVHRGLIEAKLAEQGLPSELLAVPLVESGYRNLPADKIGNGAGIWMFIAPTARKYGLRVDERTDERLNVADETDAALRMLADLQRHFGDWNLALLAYNAGNATVERGIRATGSRDAWRIAGQGYENDYDYLPRVMAGILILSNPEYVK